MSFVGQLIKAGIVPRSNGQLEFRKPCVFTSGLNSAIGRGRAFYVDSNNGSDNNSGKTPYTALATIDTAIGKCEANRGDIIYVLPGHTEDVSSATSIVCDVAGVSIVGLGYGSLRPTLSFTAAAAKITVSAANVTFSNIIFNANYADVAEAFVPAAKYLTLHQCEFKAAATNKNFVEIIDTGTTNNQCDGLTIVDCSWIEPDTAATSMCNIDADIDQLTIMDCYVNLGVNTNDLPILVDVATGKDVTNLFIKGNICVRLNDANPLLLTADTTTANTGIICNNYVRHADTDSELLVTAGTKIGLFENYCTAADDKSGFILPAVDS